MDARCFSFGPYVLIPQRQVLLRGNTPVRMGIRALDLLAQFVQRAGEILEKRELLGLVWADAFVDESNLKVTIAVIRKTLDEKGSDRSCIATVIGRGYRFVETVRVHRVADADASKIGRCSVPGAYGPLVGRNFFLTQLMDQMSVHRLVTLVGAPGAGKTVVAAAAARGTFEQNGCRAVFVGVGDLNRSADTAVAIANALKLDPYTCDPVPAIADAIQSEDVLLVLDGCESHLESIAALAERLLASCPNLRLLLTSREPLQVSQERVVRLAGLDTPPRHARLSTAEMECYPAVELFLRRTYEGADRCSLQDAQAYDIFLICADLEGIPLAIEFAAAVVRSLGFSSAPMIATEEFFHFPAAWRHRAEHHRSLAASLDRSFDLLSDREQLVLARLSRFSGSFDLETAIIAAGGPVVCRAEALACIASLVSKSLVEKTDSRIATFHLLHCIRLYARMRLATIGSPHESYRDHLEISRELLSIDGYRPKSLNDCPRMALSLALPTGV